MTELKNILLIHNINLFKQIIKNNLIKYYEDKELRNIYINRNLSIFSICLNTDEILFFKYLMENYILSINSESSKIRKIIVNNNTSFFDYCKLLNNLASDSNNVILFTLSNLILQNNIMESNIEILCEFKKEFCQNILYPDNQIIYISNIFTNIINSLAYIISERLKYEEITVDIKILMSSISQLIYHSKYYKLFMIDLNIYLNHNLSDLNAHKQCLTNKKLSNDENKYNDKNDVTENNNEYTKNNDDYKNKDNDTDKNNATENNNNYNTNIVDNKFDDDSNYVTKNDFFTINEILNNKKICLNYVTYLNTFMGKSLKYMIKHVCIKCPELKIHTTNMCESIKKDKGSLGKLVEKIFFGINPNPNPNPDIVSLGIDIKTTNFKLLKKTNTYNAKERLTITNCGDTSNYKTFDNIVENKIFTQCKYFNKIKEGILLIFDNTTGNSCLLNKKFLCAFYYNYYTMPDFFKKQINKDYQTIRKLIISNSITQSGQKYLHIHTHGIKNSTSRALGFKHKFVTLLAGYMLGKIYNQNLIIQKGNSISIKNIFT